MFKQGTTECASVVDHLIQCFPSYIAGPHYKVSPILALDFSLAPVLSDLEFPSKPLLPILVGNRGPAMAALQEMEGQIPFIRQVG